MQVDLPEATFELPPGRLGVIFTSNFSVGESVSVGMVYADSPLAGKLPEKAAVLALDGRDVSMLSARELIKLLDERVDS